MYNSKILAKALGDIAKHEAGSKYKICAIKGNIWVFYEGGAMYPTTNYIGLSIENPDVIVDERTVNNIYKNIEYHEQEIRPTGYTINDLTEFITENGEKVYCKTKLLKDVNINKYTYFTYIEKKYICVYDDSAKDFLLAVICPVIKRGETN